MTNVIVEVLLGMRQIVAILISSPATMSQTTVPALFATVGSYLDMSKLTVHYMIADGERVVVCAPVRLTLAAVNPTTFSSNSHCVMATSWSCGSSNTTPAPKSTSPKSLDRFGFGDQLFAR
jgi:hypothetical protein